MEAEPINATDGKSDVEHVAPPATTRQRRGLPTPLLAFTLVVIGLRVVLAWHAPVEITGTAAEVQVLETAQHIGAGAWLGPYDDATLAHPPGYPLFLALARAAQLPRALAEILVHALAVLLLGVALRRLGVGVLVTGAALALVLLTPAAFAAPLRHVNGGGLVGAQVLLILGSAAALLAPAGVPLRAALAALLGVALAWFRLTVDEPAWLLPSLAVLAIGLWVAERRRSGSAVAATTWCAVIVAVVAAIPWCADRIVRDRNAAHYGVPVVDELGEGSFPLAIGAIQRVSDVRSARGEPLDLELRERLAAASPAFAALREPLERRIERAGGEVGAYRFAQLVRQAARETGQHSDAPRAAAFYAALAAEVDAACDDGALPAGPRRSGRRPRFTAGLLSHAGAVLWGAFRDVVTITGPDADPGLVRLPRVTASAAVVSLYEAQLGTHSRPPLDGARERAAAVARIRNTLASWYPALAFFALMALATQLVLFRERGLAPLFALELAAFLALASRAALVAVDETWWRATDRSAMIPTHFILPVWLLLGLHAYVRFPDLAAWRRRVSGWAPAPERRLRWTLGTVTVTVAAFLALWWAPPPGTNLVSPDLAAAVAMGGLDARLVSRGCAVSLDDDGALVFAPRGPADRIDVVAVGRWHGAGRDLELEAATPGVPEGTLWAVAWSEPVAGAPADERPLFAKGPGRHRWRVALPDRALDRITLVPPRGPRGPIALTAIRVLDRGDAAPAPPESRLTVAIDATAAVLRATVVQGEPESRYVIYFATRQAPKPLEFPDFIGTGGLDVESTVLDASNDPLHVTLTTDHSGSGRGERPLADLMLPPTIFAQGVGMKHFTDTVPVAR